MKSFIPALFSILLIACSQAPGDPISEKQTEQIKSEIQPVIKQVIESAAHADTAKLFEVFSFTDHFLYVDITGKFYEAAAYKQMVREFWGQLSTEIIEKGTEKYIYLGANNVLWSYSGSLALTFKNGGQARYNHFGLSMFLTKENGKWKVVFVQESTQEPPVADTATDQ